MISVFVSFITPSYCMAQVTQEIPFMFIYDGSLGYGRQLSVFSPYFSLPLFCFGVLTRQIRYQHDRFCKRDAFVCWFSYAAELVQRKWCWKESGCRQYKRYYINDSDLTLSQSVDALIYIASSQFSLICNLLLVKQKSVDFYHLILHVATFHITFDNKLRGKFRNFSLC